MNTLIPVSYEIFKENVSVKFNNIIDGFNNYLNFEIKGNENNITDFLIDVFKKNDNTGFVDLYLNNLNEDDKSNLLKMCCPEDKNTIIDHLNLNHSGPYYKITDKSLIPFLARLNTREVFFVTFYFTKMPLTIWGNYNMTFPCFTDKNENFNFYKKIAKLHNLV